MVNEANPSITRCSVEHWTRALMALGKVKKQEVVILGGQTIDQKLRV